MSRNYHAEIIEATMAGDIQKVAALAHELAGMAAALSDRRSRDANRQRKHREAKEESRDVTLGHVTQRDGRDSGAVGSPLVPPSPLPEPNSPPPFNPPSRSPRSARAAGAGKPDRPSGLDVLPKEHVDRAYARWVRDLGACNYARLRKALLPIYAEPSANHPTADELESAVGAFLDGRDADNPAFRAKWNVEKFANELPNWVDLGRMSYVTEWGIPTPRGILTGLFSAA